MLRKILFLILASLPIVTTPAWAQSGQFGKNNVPWDKKDYRFYGSYHFDIWHTFDINDPAEARALGEVVGTLESAYTWMSDQKLFGHNIEKRIPVIIRGTHREFQVDVARITGEFVPEGVGALVEPFRHRLITKMDSDPTLTNAIDTHELVHEFQFDIEDPGLLKKFTEITKFPGGYYEGCAEYIAGLYDPHTRDDLRRQEQRIAAANAKRLLPTWNTLNSNGAVNPYTMWSMVPEFLEDEFSGGIKFCTQPLKGKESLGEWVYDISKGKLGNPDTNYEKFDQAARTYWTKKFKADNDKRPNPYDENENFKGRSITPFGYPYPVFSPVRSPDGTKLAAFTVDEYVVSLVIFNIPKEDVYVSKEEREKAKKSERIPGHEAEKQVKNLTPYLPPVPWEYLVVQGFETGPFNGFDVSWSRDGQALAVFAQADRDHALFIIDAKTGKITKKMELPLDQAFSPSFNPDGKKVYFSAAKNITRHIYVVDLESGAITNLTNGRFDTAPAVSPDGDKVVYVAKDGAFQHLFILHLADGRKEQITFGKFNDGWPSWSDDSTTIGYSSDEADRIWNLYTLNLETRNVKQWTEFFGGTETPVFAKNSINTVYYVVYRDDDQFKNLIYPNFEVFEAELKKPVREYTVKDTGPAGEFIFNPARDLFKFELDENQILNPTPPPERWNCKGGDISFGMSTYWGMFGQSYFGCSNLLETKHHLFQFAMYGDFRLVDYSYDNEEGRTTWLWGVHNSQFPLFYQFYDVTKGRPNQFVLNQTWINESSVDLFTSYPLNKFNRWELYSKLRRRSFKVGFDQAVIDAFPDLFTPNDVQLFKLFNDSSGSNFIFGAAYVRDTVLFSNNTWGPFHGNAFRAQVEFAPPLGAELKGYSSANVSARTYRHLGPDSLFAARVDLLATTKASGEFMLLCGPERLRGCDYGSMVGNQVGYASAELRFPIPGTAVLYQGIRGFLFADAAVARFSDDGFPAQKLKTYGFGLQYVIPLLGLPAQSIWTRDNDRWKSTFYVTLHW